MNRGWQVRVLQLAIATTFAIGTLAPVYATTFGPIQVQSYIGQPFRAVVKVDDITLEQFKSAKVSRASDTIYAQKGIKKTPEQGDLSFVLFQKDGAQYIGISSRKAITTPFLEFVLTWRENGQDSYREYTAFLDLNTTNVMPQVANQVDIQPASAATKGWGGKPVTVQKTTSSVMAEKASQETLAPSHRAGERIGPITSGQTLFSIALSTRPTPNYDMQTWIDKIYQANPRSFAHRSKTGLMIGSYLTIPDAFAKSTKVAVKSEIDKSKQPQEVKEIVASDASTSNTVVPQLLPSAAGEQEKEVANDSTQTNAATENIIQSSETEQLDKDKSQNDSSEEKTSDAERDNQANDETRSEDNQVNETAEDDAAQKNADNQAENITDNQAENEDAAAISEEQEKADKTELSATEIEDTVNNDTQAVDKDENLHQDSPVQEQLALADNQKPAVEAAPSYENETAVIPSDNQPVNETQTTNEKGATSFKHWFFDLIEPWQLGVVGALILLILLASILKRKKAKNTARTVSVNDELDETELSKISRIETNIEPVAIAAVEPDKADVDYPDVDTENVELEKVDTLQTVASEEEKPSIIGTSNLIQSEFDKNTSDIYEQIKSDPMFEKLEKAFPDIEIAAVFEEKMPQDILMDIENLANSNGEMEKIISTADLDLSLFSTEPVADEIKEDIDDSNQATFQAMEINLDLAKTYIDSGVKSDKAKEWLKEVLEQGNAEQKIAAQELLDKID